MKKAVGAILLYADVLRSSLVFGILIVGIPLTAIYDVVGSPMLGNLFADYGFLESLIFGGTIFSAAWALLLTAGLSLDGFRDRKEVAEPASGKRWLTIPLNHISPFVLFSLLALPGALAVLAHSNERRAAIAGFVAGGAVAYMVMDFAISLIRLADHHLRVLWWDPHIATLVLRTCPRSVVRVFAFIPMHLIRGLSTITRSLNLPSHLFDSRGLKGDHVLAALSLVWMLLLWFILYAALGPDGPFSNWPDMLPPAGFVYFLIVFFILLVSPLSTVLRRRRLMLPSLAVWILMMGLIQSTEPGVRLSAFLTGRPAHTYDVYPMGDRKPVTTLDLLKEDGDHRTGRTLIVVAASGGGILAAGWTAKVLSELHSVYPDFSHDLRLISAVSGGSVGTAYYLNALARSKGPLNQKKLLGVIEGATATSLSSAAFGFAFPDLRRSVIPFWSPDTDRARLQEARWQRVALNGGGSGKRVRQLLADWNENIRHHKMPAFIFNATVMETGERIAITPLASLRHLDPKNSAAKKPWPGWTPSSSSNGDPVPVRRNSARTLSEFLNDRNDYTIDLWTAARLSATFSYVSPPATARLCDEASGECDGRIEGPYAPLHLIDGGYNENYGVASALDWITRVARHCRVKPGDCSFDRIALVEIRATPISIHETPQSELVASWFGPPLGIMNSWAFAQTSANDTAVERLIEEMNRPDSGIKLESFVFEPELGDENAARTKDWCKDDAPRCCCLRCCRKARASEDGGSQESRARRFSLSWHLSRAERKRIHEYWRDPQNQCALSQFLRFVRTSEKELDVCGAPVQNVTPAES